MIRLAVASLVVSVLACASEPLLDTRLKSIENRYNSSQSLRILFSESYAGTRRPVQNESGTLFLRKPGMMRWEYAAPAGKLFISDGKQIFLYTPTERRVEKGSLKDSEDLHAPLAFLLGRLDFHKEFQSFTTHPEGEDLWIDAEPRSKNLAYSKVEFLATADGQIRKVRVTGQDSSTLNFTFSGEQLNAPVSPALFAFKIPEGVEVVEAGR